MFVLFELIIFFFILVFILVLDLTCIFSKDVMDQGKCLAGNGLRFNLCVLTFSFFLSFFKKKKTSFLFGGCS